MNHNHFGIFLIAWIFTVAILYGLLFLSGVWAVAYFKAIGFVFFAFAPLILWAYLEDMKYARKRYEEISSAEKKAS